MKRALPITLAVMLCFGVFDLALHAQTPKPDPELKKLDVLVGSWTFEWDAKASIFGPAGKVTGIERSQWMPGGFFLQMNREAKAPAGAFRHTVIFGFDPITKRHTGQFFDFTEGGSTSATIAITGNTWNWSGTGHTGTGKAFQERCIANFATGGASWTLKCEANTDGKTWSPTIEGKYTKSS